MPPGTRSVLADRVTNPGLVLPVVVGVLGLAAAGWALHLGADVPGALVVAVLALAVGTAAGLLPRRWSVVLAVVGLVGGLIAVRWTEPRMALTWFLLLGCGMLVGTRVTWQRQQAARSPRATTAALRLVHDDDGDGVESVDPSADEVRDAVRRLDGRRRTGVSVFRGTARLDVGGDAAGPVVCFQSDDVRTARPTWSVLTGGPDGRPAGEVEVRVAGVDAHLPAGAVSTLDPALTALETFLRTGARADSLPWRTDPDVEDLRALFDTFS